MGHDPHHDPRWGRIKRVVLDLGRCRSRKTRRIDSANGYLTYRVFQDRRECKWVILVVEGAKTVGKRRKRRKRLYGTVIVICYTSLFVITQYPFERDQCKYKAKYVRGPHRWELLPSEFPQLEVSALSLNNSNGNGRR